MFTGAQPLPRLRRPSRRLLLVLAGLAAAVGIAVAVDRLALSGGEARPDLQRVLDGLVSGSQRAAPGATAYVVGPKGTWTGAAGTANLATGAKMAPDARLRIQSNSKTWLLAVMLQLADEGKLTLDDTVSHWLPGLLPYGDRITIRELMTDTSGLIDDNDLTATSTAFAGYLAHVQDAGLRTRLSAIAANLQKNPAFHVDPIWMIRLAAWQPLLSTPGTTYHHSNIGWNIAGMIAARAGGKPLAELYRAQIFQPLGLTHTSYQPQGPIAGPHADGYFLGADGSVTDSTAFTWGKGADGGVVSDAADEAAFLLALVSGTLHLRPDFLAFYGGTGLDTGGCPGNAFRGFGAGAASRTYVTYDQAGERVAVLFLNGMRENTGESGDKQAEAAALRLYCGS